MIQTDQTKRRLGGCERSLGRDPSRRWPPGCPGRNSAGGPRGLCPCGAAALLGRAGSGDSGCPVCLVGNVGQRGIPPYFPASKITSSERFQFRPVSAQLLPSCGAIFPRLSNCALESLAHRALLEPFAAALCRERQLWSGSRSRPGDASHPRALCAWLLRGREKCLAVPSCFAGGRPVCPLAWLLDLEGARR